MKVLVTNVMMCSERSRFEEILTQNRIDPEFIVVNQYMSEKDLLALEPIYDGWLAGDDEITKSVLSHMTPRLRVISKWGTGLDSIDLDAAKDYSVSVLNSPGAFRDAVGEIAVGYMLDLSRNITLTDRTVRAGGWPKWAAEGLTGKICGIVGFGAIGKGVAERAHGLKMKVMASDPCFVTEGLDFVQEATFDQLLAVADFIVLSANLTPSNVKLIGVEQLRLMKRTAFLVNVARGPLIDQQALLNCLQQGVIAGAGLDVYEEEPLQVGSELRQMDNVVLGSHNANNLLSAIECVHHNTLKNLYSGLNLT